MPLMRMCHNDVSLIRGLERVLIGYCLIRLRISPSLHERVDVQPYRDPIRTKGRRGGRNRL